ncbi:TIGR04282 family arsenosugar biosynthesis glycosyltransferase [methanotrophic endosymbiont of Bathymodiolus puteoserpentis (Logatchev)]|uniref:TIGR04282 family arsenosugar biosynthesis glycosyltransferase n=1 Tax=methanotrophic endosymbiont of Bathymodiolus puteoserpentis (Logatchev) TaxID=343235 RepID=UPI0013CA8843|nr:TIGR04282 family arsenosugar biosynthesis glycosyltransferase [methanotrophic endosymbiont of Bathymodiolus puteoserpentis (Logatchev)]SHE23170.1 Sll1095 protein [methanotrophic endosymbiont of Bathymodiolus puteoserpentis (Logatchev)]
MSGAIAIFVKTPGLSPVKTRLAVTLGQEGAEAFHLAASQAVASVAQELSQQTDTQSYYAVAEQAALEHNYWEDLPCIWQGEGGLGERMAHIYNTLLKQHDFVLLVGADIPQMTVAELRDAVAWLTDKGQSRFAFGPSVDGGFWVFGGNYPMPRSVWTEVVYSQADTGTQFLNRIKRLGEVKTLALLCDVDEAEDLLLLRDALLNLAEPSPEQYELLRFLDIQSTHFFQSLQTYQDARR